MGVNIFNAHTMDAYESVTNKPYVDRHAAWMQSQIDCPIYRYDGIYYILAHSYNSKLPVIKCSMNPEPYTLPKNVDVSYTVSGMPNPYPSEWKRRSPIDAENCIKMCECSELRLPFICEFVDSELGFC